MVQVIRSSSVDNSQNTVVAEFETRSEAVEYIKENTVDGTNVSSDVECDYLRIEGDDNGSFPCAWCDGSGTIEDAEHGDCECSHCDGTGEAGDE